MNDSKLIYKSKVDVKLNIFEILIHKDNNGIRVDLNSFLIFMVNRLLPLENDWQGHTND